MTFQKRVLERLATFAKASGTYLQAVANYSQETRLPEAFWEELDDLLGRCIEQPDEQQGCITETCRRWLFRGPEVRHPAGGLTRAVAFDALAKTLVSQRCFASPMAARQAIRHSLALPQPVLAKRWKSISLGRFVMWATFGGGGRAALEGFGASQIRCR